MHRRKNPSVQRRKIRGLIFLNSLNDSKRGETVCQVTHDDILHSLHETEIQVCDVPDVEKGEVLIDKRGLGSFQVTPDPEKVIWYLKNR